MQSFSLNELYAAFKAIGFDERFVGVSGEWSATDTGTLLISVRQRQTINGFPSDVERIFEQDTEGFQFTERAGAYERTDRVSDDGRGGIKLACFESACSIFGGKSQKVPAPTRSMGKISQLVNAAARLTEIARAAECRATRVAEPSLESWRKQLVPASEAGFRPDYLIPTIHRDVTPRFWAVYSAKAGLWAVLC